MVTEGPTQGPELGEGRAWRRYVALGDSFTEGLCDPAGGGGHPWRGWADRLAETLAAQARAAEGRAAEAPDDAAPAFGFTYANLAVRGRLLPQIVADQVPAAIEMGPDLVSLIGGGNDVLRPGVDVDAICDLLEAAVARLRAAGADVLVSTAYDPRLSPLVRRTRGRAGAFTANVWSLARRQQAMVLDLWGMAALQDPRMWAPDRIHLTAEGHRRVALQAWEVLGLGARDWAAPLPALPPRGRAQAAREDAAWVREHVVPWVGRRVRGRSSGDGLAPKRPLPEPVPPVTT